MPPAARITDMHVCPKVEPGPVPHVGGPTSSGEPTVIIGGMPAARVGDSLVCFARPPDSISQGEATVIITGQQAARLGDGTSHGGMLVAGCPTVIIGSSAQAQTLYLAALDGIPFCEECAKRAAEREGGKGGAEQAEAESTSAISNTPDPASRRAQLQRARNEATRKKVLESGVQKALAKGKLALLGDKDRQWLESNPSPILLPYYPNTAPFNPDEAGAALEAQISGVLPAEVRRCIPLLESGGDIIDGLDKVWDIKDARGEKNTPGLIKQVMSKGENVLVDMQNIAPGERMDLKKDIVSQLAPLLPDKVGALASNDGAVRFVFDRVP